MELAGRYRLARVLGAGALGEVWEAEDQLHERPVAIKFLKAEVVASSPVLLRKFQQEARIGAVIGHPGIVRVDDFGEYDGRWYLVMEYVRGRNLQEEIDDHAGGLPLGRLLSLGAQIADALAAAHARGIVHRDLKPANIMLAGPERTVKVCDFGIAHLAEASTVNTLTGKSVGTPVYMAPEQWLGRPVDARADLYALGGTLYTLLTGAPAFTGSLLALKAQHLDTAAASPDTLRPGLPAGLADLVLRLLAKDPDDRPSSAAEVAERLRSIGAETVVDSAPEPAASPRTDSPEPTPPTPAPTDPAPTLPPPATTPPAMAPTTAAPTTGAPTTAAPTTVAPPAEGGTPPHADGATRRAVLLSLGAAAVLGPTVYLVSRDGSHGSGGPPSPPTGAARPRVSGVPLTGHTAAVTSVAFSRDGRTLASGSLDTTVRLWNVAGRTPIGEPLSKHEGNVDCVAFSPDGKLLASGGENLILLWKVADRTSSGKPLYSPYPALSVAFSPDGRLIASGTTARIDLWDAGHRDHLHSLIGHTLLVLSVAFSPDGKLLASGGDDYTVRLWNVAERSHVGKPLKHTGMVRSVAFSPDGRTLASGSHDETIRLWNVADRTPIGEPLKHTGPVNAVAFGPDGATLASACGDDTVRLWDVARRTLVGEPLKHTGPVNSVAFSPDGRTLASGGDDNAVRLWRLRP